MVKQTNYNTIEQDPEQQEKGSLALWVETGQGMQIGQLIYYVTAAQWLHLPQLPATPRVEDMAWCGAANAVSVNTTLGLLMEDTTWCSAANAVSVKVTLHSCLHVEI